MNFYSRVLKIVTKIPYGKIATYGQIAALAGSPRATRQVGWALHQLPKQKLKIVPWHRVINRKGRVSTTCMDHPAVWQAQLLKKEKISVQYKDGNYFVDLKRYLWKV